MTEPYVQDFALTLDRFLEHAAKWHPEGRGHHGSTGSRSITRISYVELLAHSKRLSAGLLELGVERGDRVATLAWNTQAHVEAWYGIAGIGAIVHTLNPRLAADTLAAMVRQAECRLMIVSASLAPMRCRARTARADNRADHRHR